MSKQYLFRVKIFSKKNSHPLETISFYSGQDQFDMQNGKQFTSNSKDNVVWSNIETPSKQDNFEMYSNLPEYLKFRGVPKKDMVQNARNILWQQVATRETREDAQLSRMFEVAIPSFLSIDEGVNLLKSFSQVLVKEGMLADCSLHARQNSLNISLMDRIRLLQNGEEKVAEKQEHASNMYQGFIVCPLRSYKNGQFVNKERLWNQTSKLEEWRYKWVELLASVTLKANLSDDERISWEEKLSIYEEYGEIKENLKQSWNASVEDVSGVYQSEFNEPVSEKQHKLRVR